MVLFSIGIGQGMWAFFGLKHENTAPLLKSRDEGLEDSGTHEYRPAADEYGMINVRAEQFRRVKLEKYTESSKVGVKTICRSRKYQLKGES